ncbi:MAG TPA: enoyl-CoA hydratase-related protein [Thermoplasmata archaeon]|nr:enoyl-CoA hydratase-related protein [Thermoplasmata archaeon]
MAPPSLRPPAVIAVLGGGNMGSGIAQACAQAGFTVRVRDVDAPAIQRGRSLMEKMLTGAVERKKLTPAKRDEILGRVTFTTDLAEAVTGTVLVVEAVFEDESVKKKLFEEIAPLVPPETVVATNTSSLSVTALADGFPHPGRFAGLHFFYPAAINKLVEIIGGTSTEPAILRELERFCYLLRKIPIETADAAGFCVNRFFVPYLNESTRLAEENVANLATIEEVGRELFGATLGPFELMNVTGIAIAFHAETSLARAFGPAYAPSKLLETQFRSGQPWAWKEFAVEPAKKLAVRERLLGLTIGIAARLVEEGVASPEATDRGATVGLRRSWGPFAQLSSGGLAEGLELVERYAKRWPGNFPVAQELRDRAARGDRTWPLRLVRVERDGPIAWVLMDRPEVLNSLNSELLGQIDATFRDLEGSPGLRAVVLAGSSPVFAAGADIDEMSKKTLAEGVDFGFLGQRVAERVERFPTPVIALVEGYAFGGGLELALAADFIVAADGAMLGLPEVTLGIHPGMGGATRLTRIIGRARTKMLVFTGMRVDAQEAFRLGIVAKVVPAGRAREEAAAIAEMIASNAPLAVRWVKQVVDRGADASTSSALHIEAESAGHTFSTRDRTEGMRAFLERRRPNFEGK